jgi:transcriptional regulator with XRE-family HTH domain
MEFISMSNHTIERSIGREIKRHRTKNGLTIAELAKQSNLSIGMLSKIENGNTSPSLSTLQALSKALLIPITAFFRKFEEKRHVSYVKAGAGMVIDRRGTRTGHNYELLGHSLRKDALLEPYLLTLTKESEVSPFFEHSGTEFIYMLEGEMMYAHGDRSFHLSPGDSLLFDAEAIHGPEELIQLPIKFLSVMVSDKPAETD